jgi:hypothetical protein
MGWHDRHQAPFYRADHAVNVRLDGGGLIARLVSIADLGHFSQGAFGTENRPCFPLSQRFTKMSIKCTHMPTNPWRNLVLLSWLRFQSTKQRVQSNAASR